jgi:hypothetical protein
MAHVGLHYGPPLSEWTLLATLHRPKHIRIRVEKQRKIPDISSVPGIRLCSMDLPRELTYVFVVSAAPNTCHLRNAT